MSADAADFAALARHCGVKRELDSDWDASADAAAHVAPLVRKKRFLERRKSVRFADEVDSELECVYPIPVKEETWPYGSLSGEAMPKAFPEFHHLYNTAVAKALDYNGFVSAAGAGDDTTSSEVDDLACFDDLRSCVGLSFLMMDGSITRAVCATSRGLWGKKFVRHEALVDLGFLDGQSTAGVRPADYLETDMYVCIDRSQVASVCRILCADGDLSKAAPLDGTLTELTATLPKHNGKQLKAFFYSWYFCQTAKDVHPYLSEGDRNVSVFWPEDRKWYEGRLDGARAGLHRVVYDCDGSEEYVNLLQLREQGCLMFVD